MTVRTIKLYGDAGKKFGKEHKVDADTTFMLFRGLTHLLGIGFKKYIKTGTWRVLKNTNTKSEKNALTEFDVHKDLDDSVHTLHIVPVIAGAGAWVRIIIGAVLVAYGTFGQAYGGGPWATSLGMGLMLGGVAQLMTPSPKAAGASAQSFNFNGPQNNTAQGGPVPIVYGQVRAVGGTLISAGINYDRISN